MSKKMVLEIRNVSGYLLTRIAFQRSVEKLHGFTLAEPLNISKHFQVADNLRGMPKELSVEAVPMFLSLERGGNVVLRYDVQMESTNKMRKLALSQETRRL